MNEKLLEKSLAHSKYTFVIIITPAKILASMILVWEEMHVSIYVHVFLCECEF